MDMFLKCKKALYGLSEKSRYVLGEERDQISLFNKWKLKQTIKLEEPTVQSIVTSHTRNQRNKRNLPKWYLHGVICDLDENKRM